jgi:uncharacterized surface protein with fasciclin (FAS1) repeats
MRVARNRGLVGLSVLLILVAGACQGGFRGAVPYTGLPKPSNVPKSITDVLSNDPQKRFTTLLDLVSAARLSDTINGTGPLTLFAPTNDAIRKGYTDAQLQALKQDVSGLTTMVKSHLVNKDVVFSQPAWVKPVTNNGTTVLKVDGKVSLEDAGMIIVSSDTALVTLAGTRVTVSPDKSITKVAGSTQKVHISQADVQAPNGWIQVIDDVLTK